MKRVWIVGVTAALFLFADGLIVAEAAAQRLGRSGPSLGRTAAARSVGNITSRRIGSSAPRAISRVSRPSVNRGAGSIGRGGGSRLGRPAISSRGGSDRPLLNALGNRAVGGGNQDFPLLNGLANALGGNQYQSQTPILDRLLGAYEQDQYYDNYYRRDEIYADAIRDAAIANAVVGVVGIVADSATRSQAYKYGVNPYGAPGYGAGGYGAQPVYTAPSQGYAQAAPVERGQYVRERIVVEPERYVQEQVWIPERYDPTNGRKIGGGYHETRTQLVPERVEYRDVWVPQR